MKKTLVLLFLSVLFLGAKAQSDLPNVTLKNLDGETVNITELNNDGKLGNMVCTMYKRT